MKKTLGWGLGAMIALLLLGACSTAQTQAPIIVRLPTKFTATGHGSLGAYGPYNAGQQKLMAMRAARLDAYRNLAEQVYGFQITGSTTVNAFATQSDTLRAYIDAHLKGAKILSVIQQPDGLYEATAELEVPADFGACIVNGGCAVPPPPVACTAPSCTPVGVMCVGSGCASPSGAEWMLTGPAN